MDFTVAETMPKSTTKDGQVNFHIHEDVDAPEKIQHNEEKERCIFFFNYFPDTLPPTWLKMKSIYYLTVL